MARSRARLGLLGFSPWCLGLATLVAPALARASVSQISLGSLHTCAVQGDGGLRCWGYGGIGGLEGRGQLGYGNTNDLGDDETPFAAGAVPVGASVTQVAAGFDHTCAILVGGGLRCWGEAFAGQLGYGNTSTLGDNETPSTLANVNLGGAVVQVAAGEQFTCALLGTGQVKCFGQNDHAQLGQAAPDPIGDDELPLATAVPLGGTVIQVAAGGAHACALLSTGSVRCWGDGEFGQLGYGNTNSVGDLQTPAAAGDVAVGGPVSQITVGSEHSCALLQTGRVRCWGGNGYGQLGYGNLNPIGDDEDPATVGPVEVSLNPNLRVTQISAGAFHTCALLENGQVVCWGDSSYGKLGYPGSADVGDDERPSARGAITLGGVAVQVAAGGDHTCARLDTGRVRCWGDGEFGQLGYANRDNIGDDEVPQVAGEVPIDAPAPLPLPRMAGAGYAGALIGAALWALRRQRRD